MTSFFLGFEKRASTVDAVKAVVNAGKNVAKKGATDLGEYWKKGGPTDGLKGWQKRMVAEGKKPVGVQASAMPRTPRPHQPLPPLEHKPWPGEGIKP